MLALAGSEGGDEREAAEKGGGIGREEKGAREMGERRGREKEMAEGCDLGHC